VLGSSLFSVCQFSLFKLGEGVKPEWRLVKGTIFSVFAAVQHFSHHVTRRI
jgi:hypothetical protein